MTPARRGTMMSTESPAQALAADARARLEALDTRRSLLLQAPAGSGKTTVLTCRFLALLAIVDEPEQILAITFTRKAAAEMRARVLRALQAAASGEPATFETPHALAALAQSARRGWALLESPVRLRIQTIDALNHQLARALPVTARGGAALEIAQPATLLYQRAARQSLRAALADPEAAAPTERVFARLDNRWQRLEDLLGEMLARRSHWLPHVLGSSDPLLLERVAASVRSIVSAQLARARAAIPAPLLQEASALMRHALGAGAAGEGAEAAGSNPEDLPYWRGFCELALTKENRWREQYSKRQGFATDAPAMKARVLAWNQALRELPDLLPLLVALRVLPDAQLGPEEADTLSALSVLLRRAAAELQLVFAERGRVDYTYVAACARQALSSEGEPTDLALRFGEAITHILIDEFQDTSVEQFALLEALMMGWQQGDGRTLFAVGDPMQSIYQFREAEVGLFLQARAHGIGTLALEPLALRRNFRSAPSLVQWVNEQFVALFPRSDDSRLAAVRYLDSVAARTERSGAVHVHAEPSADPQAEARHVLEIVRAARAERPSCSIAVLVAARAHAVPICSALAAGGYTVRGVDLEPLERRPLVRDLMALARSLVHPLDRTAWLGVLRAPWLALPLAELAALGGEATDPIWPRIRELALDESYPHQPALMRLCAALAPALEGEERFEPLWIRTERCWLRLGGPALALEVRELADARALLRALAADGSAEQLAGEGLGELAQGLYAQSGSGAGAIDVLTLHGAKGLEWDCVIVPGLGRVTARDREPLLHWLELARPDAGSDLLLAPIGGLAEVPHALAHYIGWLRRERQRIERMRVLYVAATRARSQLHWLGHAPADEDGTPTPRTGSLLALLWPAIGVHFPAQAELEVAAEIPARTLTGAYRLQLPPPDPAAAPAPTPRVERLGVSLRESPLQPEYRWVGQSARAVGTIVHAELQRLAEAGGDPRHSIAREAHAYAGWLAELGVPELERPAARARVLEALERTLSDERGRWLLSADHRHAVSEFRLSGLLEGRVINVIFDRMLIDEAGVRWIIDYKTSTHEGGALEGFLAQEAERYRPQLERYARFAAQLGPEPVRTALYFPLLGAFREVGR
jgi:ATP-dependent helicase/nuclease subunit A